MNEFEFARRSILLSVGTLGVGPILTSRISRAADATPGGYVLDPSRGEHLIHFRDGGDIFIMAGTARGSDKFSMGTQQWPKVAGDDPYGMPSMDGTSPAVFVMPASWKGVTWMVIPSRKEVPPGMLRKALANGKKWNQVKFEGCDGIGTHEVGHSIIRQLGIDPQTRWFNEFLASVRERKSVQISDKRIDLTAVAISINIEP